MSTETENKIQFRQQALQGRYDYNTMTSAIPVFRYYSFPLLAVLSFLCSAAVLWGFLGSVPTWIQGEGILLPFNNLVQSVISPDGPAIVTAFHHKPGDTVKEGETIVTLDKPTLREQITILQYKLKQTQAIYNKMQENSKKEYAERLSRITTQNEQIKKSIQLQSEFQKNSEDLLAVKKNLQSKHLITNSDVLSQQQNIIIARLQAEDLRERIIGNEFQLSQLSDNWNDKLRNLELQILSLKNDIEVQQKQLELMKAVKSPGDGNINFLHKAVGDSAIAGEILATILGDSKTLEVVSYVPAQDAELIEVGQRVLISPTIYQKEEYGSMEGEVTFISDLPISPQEIMSTFKNEDLVKLFTNKGPTFKIKIKLTSDSSSSTGVKWTSSQGPDKKLSQGTLVHTQVSVRERSPINLIMPAVRSLWGGSR